MFKVWHITPDVGYDGNLLYNLTNNAKKIPEPVTRELKIVIGNTKWQGDESWWISLKEQYDSFFAYEWDVENLKYSFEHARKNFGCSTE